MHQGQLLNDPRDFPQQNELLLDAQAKMPPLRFGHKCHHV